VCFLEEEELKVEVRIFGNKFSPLEFRDIIRANLTELGISRIVSVADPSLFSSIHEIRISSIFLSHRTETKAERQGGEDGSSRGEEQQLGSYTQPRAKKPQPTMSRSRGEGIANLASVTTFESTDLTTFRRNLAQAIRAVLAATATETSSTTGAHSNDSEGDADSLDQRPSRIQDVFVSSIPWRQLCNAHDKTKKVRSGNKSYASALEEVCGILCNPTVIPIAYIAPLFISFLRVMLIRTKAQGNNGTHKWRASEEVLLKSMMMFSSRLPSQAFGSLLQEYQAPLLELNQTSAAVLNKTMNADRLHKFISVLSYIAVTQRSSNTDASWFQCTCVRLYLQLAQSLDDMDLAFLRKKELRQLVVRENKDPPVGTLDPADAKKDMCLQCQERILPLQLPTMRRRGVSLMALLDDDGDGDEPISTTNISPNMVAVTNQCRCSHSVRQPLSQASSFTQLPFSFVTLRSRAYEQSLNLVLTASLSIYNQKTDRKSVSAVRFFASRNFGLSVGAARVLETLLDEVCGCPASPSLRLSLLLTADAIGSPKALDYVLRNLWKRFDASRRVLDIGVLRIWSELVVESSHFDVARCCWDAMEPLLTRILAYCGDNDDDASDGSNAKEATKLDAKVYPLLRSLAHVLSRRRPTLKSDSRVMNLQFHDFVTRVSISFGESMHWISPCMNDEEVTDIIRTLQNVGILGLPIGSRSAEDVHPLGDHACCAWPFAAGIRGAHERMGPHVSRIQLLSEPEDVNELVTQFLIAQLADTEEDAAAAMQTRQVPIMAYLNDDNLRTVLSFLDPVHLVRIGGVDRTCRILAHEDARWKEVYSSSYGILGDDVDRVVSQIGSWRNLFVEKYYSEKALKFKYCNSTGFKYRTCGYVGCYQVMKSLDRQAKHYAVHEARIATKLQRHEAVQKRKLERDVKRKLTAVLAKQHKVANADKKRQQKIAAKATAACNKRQKLESTNAAASDAQNQSADVAHV
jgi:hypothetical protein